MARARTIAKEYFPFAVILAVNAVFLVLALTMGEFSETLSGFSRIIQSRSILVTDYLAVGGVYATLFNVAITGVSSVLLLFFTGAKPSGSNIMALWLTMGFAFFGKNTFNMIPLTMGVWLYARHTKGRFADYSLSALLVATLSPVISEISFFGRFARPVEIAAGVITGFAIGFIFPAITAESVKTHSGYNLYNVGFAGGLIATIMATCFRSLGIDITGSSQWSAGNNGFFAALLYAIAAGLFATGLFAGGAKKNLQGFRMMFKHSGRLVTDFYYFYENSIFINMGVLCALSTTLVLALGAELNGPAIAGIFTIVGFGCFGKHARNVVPVIIGSVASAFVNRGDINSPGNIVAILFSTGLAPIAGQFGWGWGIAAGFLHLNVAQYIGHLNSGLNLYNNGFAASFVAMFLLPVITTLRKEKRK